MQELIEKQLQLEKKDKQKSAAITFGMAVLLLFFSMFWVAFRGMNPPIDEPQWRTVGFISGGDFGNRTEGSQDVNNFEDPSPTPSDNPKTDVKSNTTETHENTSVSDAAAENHSETTSEQVVQESDANPSNDGSSNTNTNSNSNNTNANTNNTNSNNNANNNSGGSNDGNSNGVGNQGSPNSTILGEGLFEFGPGIGAGGRGLIGYDIPGYEKVNEEGIVKFKIIVDPSGEVVYAKAIDSPFPGLSELGENALKKFFRFNQIDEGAGRLTSTIKITFRKK